MLCKRVFLLSALGVPLHTQPTNQATMDQPTMDTEDVRNLVQTLHGTAIDMDDQTLGQCIKTCHIIEQITSQHCRDVIARAGNRPCLLIFMSDGWSSDLRTTTVNSAGGVTVDRKHRLRFEFVMQRTIVKTVVDPEVVMGIKMERPRLLGFKQCADLWNAACDTCLLLKLSGHKGISVSVYLQDGLFSKPFGRRMVGRHASFFSKSDIAPSHMHQTPIQRSRSLKIR